MARVLMFSLADSDDGLLCMRIEPISGEPLVFDTALNGWSTSCNKLTRYQ